jgi:DNA polymerase elongation subunit (family B)
MELSEYTDDELLALRKNISKKVLNLGTKEQSIKISLNSLYGAYGNQYFRYFSMPMAEGITASGRMAIQWAEKAVNQYLNKILSTDSVDYVIAIDTDSLYVNMGDLVDRFKPSKPIDFLDTICSEKIEPVIADAYARMYDRFGGYENRMEMSREVIADRGIWTAKKRYILNVHDNEGVRYSDPKLKIMGIEAIKSSTPSACREGLKEIFKVIISGSEEKSQEAIQTFKRHFKTLPPEDVSFPRGVSDIDKWVDPSSIYLKGTPIHVRGALLYNNWIDRSGNGSRYGKVSNGDKVKFTYLRTPNPIRENVVSYPAYLPPEMGLHEYIDYDTQFEKSFVDVIRPIFRSIGWEIEKQNTLEDLIG